MATTDATPIPVKNQAYRVTFPILDADGDLVTAATALDSEVSKDAGTFVDCTNEATEIATSSGMYYLDLTATEMNADTVAIIVKTTSSGAKTTPMVLYPNKAGGLAVNVTAWAGSATGTGNVAIKNTLAKTTDITGFNDITTANVQTELTTYGALKPTTAGRTLDVTTTGEAGVDWANIGAPATVVALSGTTVKAATDVTNPVTLTAAYDAAKVAASQASVNTIATYVDTEVASIKTVTDKLDTALEIDGAVYRYTTNALEQAPVGGGGGGGDASQATLLAVKAKTDALPGDPADASDIADSFATTNGKIDTIAGYVDTEIAAIKAQTDQLSFTSGKVNANATTAIVAGDLTAIADAILKRDFSAVSGEAAYSLLNAARMLRNVWNTPAGVLHVKKEDGTTDAWTRTLAVDPSAQPIVGAS